MRRKLVLLNLLLAGLTVGGVLRLRQEWLEARAREEAVLRQHIKPTPAPPVKPLPAPKPVQAATYIDIAQKMLFSKDRNPTVFVPVVAPPPPPPMPPLPVFHGLLNVGEGPTAIMSEKAGAQHRDYRPGDQVGQFKLVAVSTQEIVLEWEGKTITKQLDELLDRTPLPPPPTSGTNTPPPSTQPRVIASAQPSTPGPGADLGGRGLRACKAGDDSASGTVAEGWRKVIKGTPFGQTCYWESAN